MNTNNGKLTRNQREVLKLICQGARTGTEIAGKIGERSRQGVAQSAAALVRKGWVERVRIRGIVHYRATDAGWKKLPENMNCWACRTGSGRHTCGLRELQDMLSIPVRGRYAGPPRRS